MKEDGGVVAEDVQEHLDYGKATSFSELYIAANECDNGVNWKDSVIKWMFNLLSNLSNLRKRILNGTYRISEYIRFTLHEPKTRTIFSTKFIDRVFQRSMCNNGLYWALTRSLIYNNCACQIGKGTSFAIKRFDVMLHDYYNTYGTNHGFAVIIDIHDYFGSIPHGLLKDDVAKAVPEPNFRRHVFDIIDSFKDGRTDEEIMNDRFGERGIGLGSQISQLLALLYTSDLDHYAKEQLLLKFYIKYMDDIVIFVRDYECALEVYNKIIAFIRSKGLEPNPKSRIVPLEYGVKFLKVDFKLTPTGSIKHKISAESINRELRRITVLLKLYRDHMVDFDYLLQHFNSWVGHFKMRMSTKQFPILNGHIRKTMVRLGMDSGVFEKLNNNREDLIETTDQNED